MTLNTTVFFFESPDTSHKRKLEAEKSVPGRFKTTTPPFHHHPSVSYRWEIVELRIRENVTRASGRGSSTPPGNGVRFGSDSVSHAILSSVRRGR